MKYLFFIKKVECLNRSYKRREFLNVKKLAFFTKKSYFRKKHNLKLFLKFGSSAIVNSQPMVVSNGFLLKFALLLKRVIKKKGKSFRFFFFRPTSLIKVSKQSKGARMGKGKGKSIMLIQRFLPYKTLVEFSGLRLKRLIYLSQFFSNRLAADLFLYVGNFLSLFGSTANPSWQTSHCAMLLSPNLNV